MSLIIRRFISYIGKVKLSNFKNSTHRTLVTATNRRHEILASSKPLSKERNFTNRTMIQRARCMLSLSSFPMKTERG
ncbi:predicted protein [Histoplasma mississippiense (nom. inval.)]|uniref:predicted protein n=1 Tax=Ajellomyces capsulatus (strain NAm1 / WU24) TaxID=2059318 RepID=UPI000157C377|nr:predicted protein [Histoplasma mississippiense (nom. inval.)]EDN07273.1 predicted protein [Histoplasma mississippiense (nom. inval.)]